MSDFSDRPFVAGSLVGLRAFDVDALGRLVGPSFGGVFKPGENVARCMGGGSLGARMALATWQMEKSRARYSAKPVPPRPVFPEPAPDHQVGQRNCTCGFYAYFDGTNSFDAPGRVSAVIEGYGVCTVGTRGFRAEKARLLAIIDPSMRRWWASWKFNASIAAACLFFLVLNLVGAYWIAAGIEAVAAMLNGGLAFWNYRTEQKDSSTRALVRRNYPDVPRYRTERDAIKAHPLTPPAPVTPDSTPDFWERSAG